MESITLAEVNPRYVNLGSLVDSWDKLVSRLSQKLPTVLFQVEAKSKILWVHFAAIPEVTAMFGVDCWPHLKVLYEQLKERVTNLRGPGVINHFRLRQLTDRLSLLKRALKEKVSEIEMNVLVIEIDLVCAEIRAVSECLEAIQALKCHAPISMR